MVKTYLPTFVDLDNHQYILNAERKRNSHMRKPTKTSVTSKCYIKAKKIAPDVGLEPTTLGLLEHWWLASKSPMLYRLS